MYLFYIYTVLYYSRYEEVEDIWLVQVGLKTRFCAWAHFYPPLPSIPPHQPHYGAQKAVRASVLFLLTSLYKYLSVTEWLNN